MNNKTLLYIFGALLAIFLLSKLLSGNKQRTYDPQIVQVDTAQITGITLNPKAENGVAITLNKGARGWTASKGQLTVATPANKVQGLLGQLTSIVAQRLISRDPEKWSQYEVGEQGTRVQVTSNGNTLADFVVGTFKFDQARRSASSYVRRTDGDEVFLVEGFLSMQFNQGFDAFRNNTVLTLTADDLRQLTLSGQQEAGIQRQDDGLWYFAGMEALDSNSMTQYINGIASSTGTEYIDDFAPEQQPVKTLSITGNNMLAPATVQCFVRADTTFPFVIHSSMNDNTYFLSDSAGLYQRIFGKLESILAQR